MKLQQKIALSFVIASIVIVMLVSTLGYYFAQKQVQVSVEAQMNAVAQNYVSEIDAWVRGKIDVIEAIGKILESSEQKATVSMLSFGKGNKEITSLYVGYEDSTFIEASGWVPPAGWDVRTRPWYVQAKSKGGSIVSTPYVDVLTGKYVVTVATPIKNASGSISGVVGADIQLSSLGEVMKSANVNGKGFGFLVDQNGVIIGHPDKETIGQNIKDNPYLKEHAEVMLKNQQGLVHYQRDGVAFLLLYGTLPSTHWRVGIGLPEADAYHSLSQLFWGFAVLGILAVLVVCGYALWFSRKVTRPILNVIEGAKVVAKGDLTVALDDKGKDELADLAKNFNTMRDSMRNMIHKVSQVTNQVAASSEELTTSAGQSAQATNQIASVIGEVATGVEEQLKTVSHTALVVEQMSAGVQQIAAHASTVAVTSAKSADNAQTGRKAVEKAITQMGNIEVTVNRSAQVVAKLGERSKEIGQIVDTITGIAGQTNLLALNAAIEAARAGEQGRGFSVVAEEVRQLAEQSQTAAKQITSLIKEIQVDTDSAVVAMNEGTREVHLGTEVVQDAGKTFREIFVSFNEVTAKIKEISSAIQKLATGSQQMVVSVHDMDKVSKETAIQAQTVSAATEEQSATMEEMAVLSQDLAKRAQELTQAVGLFKI